ncbi:hypothetical protein [Streptomyces nitrosporeus]|uniref:hypothetical protein n=1 Tax=Streptomyces nitrosporeus TaxID=28894 RepID=UPI00167F0875|nr:hypothetical protein [Streptomyces nitrosporeus]GGY94837.1 hypothetical protein GCM10010327_26910 [Streptomyces nitrosporeus]
MSHGLPALGVAVICLSGYVWYVPACLDVRAGPDRTHAQRTTAAAVLTGWGTAALLVPLLLAPVPLPAIALVAAAGSVAALVLAVRGVRCRGREQREAEARWSALFPATAPAPRPSGRRPAGAGRGGEISQPSSPPSPKRRNPRCR